MIEPAWASAAAVLAVGLGDACNRHVVGWIPEDPPRPGRKQHRRPMPLAGILLLPAILPWLFAERAILVSVAVAIAALVGHLDDRRKERGHDLDWRWKAIGLVAAATAGVLTVADPWTSPATFAALVLFVFVLTNATNFLDNTDGVATGLAATSLFLLSGGQGWVGAVGFAAVGFLPFNWPRPRVFLGDSGAYVLGLSLGVAAAAAVNADPQALLCVAVQLADFVQVVVARLWLGVAPWIGDRRHLSHIAQNLGVPRPLVAPLFVALAVGITRLA